VALSLNLFDREPDATLEQPHDRMELLSVAKIWRKARLLFDVFHAGRISRRPQRRYQRLRCEHRRDPVEASAGLP
jgi:hypothetical protein